MASVFTKERKQQERIEAEVLKQWFHTIFAAVNTNRPDGLSGFPEAEAAANTLQELAWKQYCRMSDICRELEKSD